jgi:DNA polymerase III epsilon subunit-like protein
MTAAGDAYRLLCDAATYVVIDTETCPSPDGHRIVSVAAVTLRQGRPRGVWSTLINPGVPITNSHQHHLTDTDVTGARFFAEVADDLDAVLAGDDVVVVAHNTRFDIGVLHLEHARAGVTLRDRRLLDTMTLPKVVGHDLGRRRSLDALATSFGIVNARPHDAVADATVTSEALLALLRLAADNGQADLDGLLAETGALTTDAIPASPSAPTTSAPSADEIPAEHLATHTTLLNTNATTDELDDWVAGALGCARLHCDLLDDKAHLALDHAATLHGLITRQLRAFAATAEPGQGATLVGALNVLAPAALPVRSARPWWGQHRSTIQAMARCSSTAACPACRNHLPCPLDIAHQPIVAAAVGLVDGAVPSKRRRDVAGSSGRCLVTDWARLGFYDLAGYAAALVADAWAAEGNHSRAVAAIDQAVTAGALDPAVVCAHAQQLANQGNHAAVADVVTAALERRTTDPAWADLADWYVRYQAATAQRPGRRRARPGASRRVARPADRTRPKRFAP